MARVVIEIANTRLSDLLQILVYLKVHEGEKISSTLLASSLNTNPSLVRQMTGQLNKAGILETQRGKATPQFTRPLTEITVLDVYRATLPVNDFLNVDQKTSEVCQVGIAFPKVLGQHFEQIQAQIEAQLAQITVAQLVEETKSDIKRHLEKGVD